MKPNSCLCLFSVCPYLKWMAAPVTTTLLTQTGFWWAVPKTNLEGVRKLFVHEPSKHAAQPSRENTVTSVSSLLFTITVSTHFSKYSLGYFRQVMVTTEHYFPPLPNVNAGHPPTESTCLCLTLEVLKQYDLCFILSVTSNAGNEVP